MGFYKIKNITPSLGKRNSKVNTSLMIDISSPLKENKVNLSPDAEFVMEANFLPISVHKMRTEGFLSVVEISKNEYQNAVATNKKRNEVPQPVQQIEVKPVIESVIDTTADETDKKPSHIKVTKKTSL